MTASTGRRRGRPPGTPKTGGRQKGGKNKRTRERDDAAKAAAARIESVIEGSFEGDAYAFLLCVFKDPKHDMRLRLDAAKTAIGYERPRLQASDVNLRSSDQTLAAWLAELDGSPRIPGEGG
jgi:hypothetical protein